MGSSGCGLLTVGDIVVCKAGIPVFEEEPKCAIEGPCACLQQQVRAPFGPLHLLALALLARDLLMPPATRVAGLMLPTAGSFTQRYEKRHGPLGNSGPLLACSGVPRERVVLSFARPDAALERLSEKYMSCQKEVRLLR